MDLFTAICAAIGVGLAAGVGGPLAWLFIAVMAGFEAGIDTGGTDWDFVGAGWFIALLFAANVAAFFARRDERRLRLPHAAGAAVMGAVFGAAAFAAEGEAAGLGFAIGAALALASGLLSYDVLEGAQRRVSDESEADPAATLNLILGLAGIAIAAVALFVPPLSLLVLVALAVLAAGRRRRAARKYEGLRVLR